jgi:ABC-2 type transport system permease protein
MLYFFFFEIRYWLRSIMLWVFTGIVALLVLLAMSTDQVTVGAAIGNTMRNAPWVVERDYAFFWFITLLMTTAFVNSAGAREFAYNMNQVIFTKPIRKFDFLLGRFFGSFVVSTIPMLGISLGALLAKIAPWNDADRFGPVFWSAQLQGILIWAIPDTLFIAAIIFAIAALTRTTIVSFLGALGLLVAYAVSGVLIAKLENEKLAALIDPFGTAAFGVMTKYWTVDDKNTHVLSLAGLLLWNRVIWIAVGLLVFAFVYWRFSFSERAGRAAKPSPEEPAASQEPIPTLLAKATLSFGIGARLRQFLGIVRIEYRRLFKSVVFIVVTCFALVNCVLTLIFTATQGFGLTTRPVTYMMVQLIAGSFYLFVIALITFFAGLLVWEERDARTDEVNDALPVPEWPSFLAKFIALMTAMASLQLLVMLVGIGVQLAHHYTRLQLGVYIETLFGQDLLGFAFLAVLAFFVHVISPNKYVGYFAYVGFVIANVFIWRPLHVATYMVQFGGQPNMTYSDFFGYQPWMESWWWFSAYWTLFCVLLAIASILLWPRGKDLGWKARFANAALRFRGPIRLFTAASAVAFVLVGGWVYWNTEVLNHVYSDYDNQKIQAGYEKNYKRYQNLPQPRIVDVQYNLALYPSTREMVLHAVQQVKNETAAPIDTLYVTTDRNFEESVSLPGAKLTTDDKRLGFQIYKIAPALAPGEVRPMNIDVEFHPKGFENQLNMNGIVQNGSFFNSGAVPQIGYQDGNELTDPNDRKRFGLKEKDLMPTLEASCTADCMNSYISNNSDWVNVDTVISTSADQIAVAPGSLIRQWQQDGRNYYEYKLDHFALNFYSFISARYTVERHKWNGMDVEVYYLPVHPWNVPRMVNSVEKSFAYYTANYGPYFNKQARIVEFPRVASFAQAFPGTMPYSESIGFIADIEKPDDIDMVYYVVAHEMGHQWWAHQVVGADMEGATSLSETLAQYSALMVMQKEYGADTMRKFMEYEMDAYLRARGAERLKERPLMRVEASQGYIHYRKGSVVMFYLSQMIGQDAINAALRQVLAQYRYAPPPYPTSWALVNALKAQTPPQYQYLLKDLFEDITLFSNRCLTATAKKRPDGKYDVTVTVETRKYKANEKGAETEVPVDDWIEVGALAAPAKGNRYGKVLARQLIHMTGKQGTYTFTTDEKPDKAGIDPLLLLIDRVPDDNLKKVDVVH